MRLIFNLLAGSAESKKTVLTKLRLLNFIEEKTPTSMLLHHASNRSVGVQVIDAPARIIFPWMRSSSEGIRVGGIHLVSSNRPFSKHPANIAAYKPFPSITISRPLTSDESDECKAAIAVEAHVVKGVKEVVVPVGTSDIAAHVRQFFFEEGAAETMHNVFELQGTHYRLLPSNVFSMSFLVDCVPAAGAALRGALGDLHILVGGQMYTYLGDKMDVRLDDSVAMLPYFREGYASILEGTLTGVQSESIWGGGGAPAGLRRVSDDCWGEVKEMIRVAPMRFLAETRGGQRRPRQGSYLE